MSGYTKLYNSILHSTVWREPNHVRITWITMLAMCDRRGVVEASLPGLADAARVTLDECRDALARLSAPDEYSRTRDYEGRRIQEVDGGWLVLNRTKYRDGDSDEHERAKWAERQRRHRERKSSPENVTAVTECHGVTERDMRDVTVRHGPSRSVTPAESESETETKQRREERETPAAPARAPRKRKSGAGEGTTRPDNWSPNERARAVAREWNLDLTLELADFCSWTTSKNWRYADWDAGFMSHLTKQYKENCKRDGDRRARYEAAEHAERKAQPIPVLPQLIRREQPEQTSMLAESFKRRMAAERAVEAAKGKADAPSRPPESAAERDARIEAERQRAVQALAAMAVAEVAS